MSIETPQVAEAAPVTTKPVEATPAESETPVQATPEPATTEAATEATETAATETPAGEALVAATPASEGVLGYKAPGLFKQFRYVKHFFWFSEEPLTQESLDAYVKSEKPEVAHTNAAWAQETGKGVLYFAKRSEDKNTPSGIILLPEATAVTKIGNTDFSFKLGSHVHKFEAASAAERDSWVVAIQKIVDESGELKADVTGRDSYKKTIEGYAFSPVVAGSSTPKKSLDANTATAAATAPAAPAVVEPVKKDDSSSVSSEEKKEKKAEKAAAKKERSQSRKRNSVFGLFGKKDEEKTDKKAEKAEKEHEKEVKKAEKAEKEHEKEAKKAEKEAAKEEKKAEAEQKKEEAKAEHDAAKAKEAAEAAAIAAAPAAVAASVEKKEEEKKEDKPVEEITTPTEKKSKRASVFGGFFGKNKITSPSTEKSEKEAGPEALSKDETPVVAENAPKLDEPIDTKPLDAAAVTAPVDNAESSATEATPVVAAAEEPKVTETAPAAADSTTTPKAEKKGFLAGLIKKHEKKEEVKEEKTNEEAAKEVVVAPTTDAAATDATPESPAKEVEAPKEERPAREKRRTSLFGSLGTLKRKTEKSPEPSSVASEEVKSPETTKREKSPMPSKLGGLFRKPSKAHKSETPAEETKTDAADVTKPEPVAEEPVATETVANTIETPASATIVDPKGESEIVGDVVPENLHTTVHDAVTTEMPVEVKATA